MTPNHLERALTFLRGAFSFFVKGLRELSKSAWEHKAISAGVLAVLIGGAVAASFVFKGADQAKPDDRREVTLIAIADVSGAEPLSLIGEVRSKREASVASDIPGTVAGVYRALGDVIGAGTVIAELKNETQRAAVAQAKAALDKARSGTTVGGIGVENAKVAFAASQETAASSIESAHATIEDAVTRKADQMFSNPSGNQPKFSVAVSSSQLIYTVEAERLSMGPILVRHANATVPTSSDGQLAELSALAAETATVADFVADISTALAGAIATNNV
ncbi:MAG: biotin/lipoyl-binding protein, partial [Patescibacteria group bacterium]